MSVYKKHYQLFLQANEGLQHYASHSHHYWPDVTRAAMLQYWDDSAKYTDDKWNYFFTQKIPVVQKLISENLKLSASENIVFAPNTHEFVNRILSCFSPLKKIKILTTDSEFYSFDRQINRLIQDDLVTVCKVPVEPIISFEERFIQESHKNHYDLIFLSQVFFNSGHAVQNLSEFVLQLSTDSVIVVDGYHGFMALPTDLSRIEDRIFYLTGAYKYAQGGEGCCFMTIPRDCALEPMNTGWFAGFGQLTSQSGHVKYARDGFRFAGSTMDYSALYRLESVLMLFKNEKITVEDIHDHVRYKQDQFLKTIELLDHPELSINSIINSEMKTGRSLFGHFYTFALSSTEQSEYWCNYLKQHRVLTDFRGDRLRFGFGLYQNSEIDLSCLK